MTDSSDPPFDVEGALAKAGLLFDLIAEVHTLAQSVEVIATELVATNARVDELRSLRRRNAIQAVTIAVALALIGVVVFVGGVRLTRIAETNRANGRYLVECATPSPKTADAVDAEDVVHECYERALVTQAQAVSLVGRDTIDAAICARTFADEAGILTCYQDRVSRRLATPTTTTP